MMWLKRLLGLAPPRQDFTFMGKTYNGDKWEKVRDPSDFPSPGYRGKWVPDMTVRRKVR